MIEACTPCFLNERLQALDGRNSIGGREELFVVVSVVLQTAQHHLNVSIKQNNLLKQATLHSKLRLRCT